ncbi:MAG TPA: ABC transporter ATP-binding protein [Acidobacteriota bacterium]|nr:ABC transporter ATP-binding protein [Acidobacteriota bacterium]
MSAGEAAGTARKDVRLQVFDLVIRFGDRRVVELEALDLSEGEIVGLAGESGAGKSLTAYALLGLAGKVGAQVSGSILLEGEQLVGRSETWLRGMRGRRIAMVFQNPVSAFNPVFRVGDVVRRALRLHGLSRSAAQRRAQEALSCVLLDPELLHRYPHQLSGGQAQRVAIALALALGTQVLVADEPTSSLDVTVQAEILQLLRRLRDERSLSVLFISHDLSVLAELCDRVAVMRDGKLVEAGPTRQLLASPREPYTRELVDAVPVLAVAEGTS